MAKQHEEGHGRAVYQSCLVCGAACLVTPSLFPDGHDRWDCPRCHAVGTIAYARVSRADDA